MLVLKEAIAREQLPRWNATQRLALAIDAGIFVAAGIFQLLEYRVAGITVTGAVVLLLVILGMAPKPHRTNLFFFERAVSDTTIGFLLSSLGEETIAALKKMSGEDSASLLRIRHLRDLLSYESAPADQQAAWRSEA